MIREDSVHDRLVHYAAIYERGEAARGSVALGQNHFQILLLVVRDAAWRNSGGRSHPISRAAKKLGGADKVPSMSFGHLLDLHQCKMLPLGL